MCAPAYVLPEPGGPWIARYVPSSRVTTAPPRRSALRRRDDRRARFGSCESAARAGAAGRAPRGTAPARRCRAPRPTRRQPRQRSRCAVVVNRLAGDQTPRVGHVAGASPRLRSIVPRTSSMSTTVPAAFVRRRDRRARRRPRTCGPAARTCSGTPSTASRADLTFVLEAADALAVVDEVVVGSSCEPAEVTPTTRASGLAPVPVQQLREEPAACCARRARPAPRRRRRARSASASSFASCSATRSDGTASRGSGRAGSGRTRASASGGACSSQSRSSRGGLAVVRVVALDLVEASRWVVARRASSRRRRCSPRVHHLARGALHVELLDLLERVRLGADAHALAHDRVEVDEHARRAAARRPRPRACRARP